MTMALLNPDLVPLLDGLRPFLGERGQQWSDIMSNVVKLGSSPAGQKTLQSISAAKPKKQTVGTSGAEIIQSSLDLAFTLFLVLWLLILASGGITFNAAEDDGPEVIGEDNFDDIDSSDELV